MEDEKLIELVRNYSILFDVSDPKYMDTSLKNSIWSKIGKEMKADGSSCKARWNNIRDNYRKSLKKAIRKSGDSGKKIKVYKYSEQLGFLKKYFQERKTTGNINSQNDEEYDQDEDDEDDIQPQEDEEENRENDAGDHIVESVVSEELQKQPLPSTKRKNSFEVPGKSKKNATKKVPPQQTASAKLVEYLINKNENQVTTISSPHPVDAFLAGLAPTLKTFSPYYLNLAKSEIFASVQNFEMKMLMEQRLSEGRPYSNFPHNVTPVPGHYSTCSSSLVSTPIPSPAPPLPEHSTTQDQHHPCGAEKSNITDNSLQDYYQTFQNM